MIEMKVLVSDNRDSCKGASSANKEPRMSHGVASKLTNEEEKQCHYDNHRGRGVLRRQLRTLVSTLTIFSLIVFVLIRYFANSPNLLSSPPMPYDTPTAPKISPKVPLVGLRQHKNLYSGCTSSEFLTQLQNSQVKHNAPSRHSIDWTPPHSNALPPFPGFSFEMLSCPAPHIFTSDEACDLLASFDSLTLTGDSFLRHVWDALLIVLSGDLSGAIKNVAYRNMCRGELLFNDRLLGNYSIISPCRSQIYQELETLPNSVCPGRSLRGKLFTSFRLFNPNAVEAYLNAVPKDGLARSPVVMSGGGVHLRYDVPQVMRDIIEPYLSLAASHKPQLIPIWQGSHAPGQNIPSKYYSSQGRPSVEKYVHDLDQLIQKVPGELITMNWFNATLGAESFDGQHYSYQVNLEKVYTLLTVLDLIWHQAVAAGGLVV